MQQEQLSHLGLNFALVPGRVLAAKSRRFEITRGPVEPLRRLELLLGRHLGDHLRVRGRGHGSIVAAAHGGHQSAVKGAPETVALCLTPSSRLVARPLLGYTGAVTTKVFRDAASRQVEANFDFTVLCCEGGLGRGSDFEFPLPAADEDGRGLTLLVRRDRQSVRRTEGRVEILGRLLEADELPVRLTRRIGERGFEFVLAS